MTKGSTGYSAKSGSPSGKYGLEKSIGGIKGYELQGIKGYHPQGINGFGPQYKESGRVYMIIGVGYTGNPNESAQGLQQYLPLLKQYLSKLSEGYGKSLQKYDAASLKGFFKPFGYNANTDGLSTCEICGAPTPERIRRCPTCSSAMTKY